MPSRVLRAKELDHSGRYVARKCQAGFFGIINRNETHDIYNQP